MDIQSKLKFTKGIKIGSFAASPPELMINCVLPAVGRNETNPTFIYVVMQSRPQVTTFWMRMTL
jgi:hypothetical protein